MVVADLFAIGDDFDVVENIDLQVLVLRHVLEIELVVAVVDDLLGLLIVVLVVVAALLPDLLFSRLQSFNFFEVLLLQLFFVAELVGNGLLPLLLLGDVGEIEVVVAPDLFVRLLLPVAPVSFAFLAGGFDFIELFALFPSRLPLYVLVLEVKLQIPIGGRSIL